MWSDNEADIDLLSFDFLVDELVVALTQPQLLPLTIGVLGDWGSGKSSLLKIVQSELENVEKGTYLCVPFSPWQYEDYDDVKLSLMRAVLDVCETHLGASEETQKLRNFIGQLARAGRNALRWGLGVAPGVMSGLAASVDPTLLDPSTAAVVATTLGQSATMLAETLDGEDGVAQVVPISSIAEFRLRFTDLLESMEGVEAIVVLIDDLDRCLPNTVLDTFEAIRLFLNSPKTAFVIAAHRKVVEAAIDSTYPAFKKENGAGLGHDYLEKMLQIQVSVPALSVQDTSTYVNLLLAHLHLPADDFSTVYEAVKERRAREPFAQPFNASVAIDVLKDRYPDELRKDLDWSEQVIPAIASTLRGNPRQTKRFLNDLRLRLSAAARRGVILDSRVLAKLMVLEELDFDAFQQLFDWQLETNGPISELDRAESPVAPPSNTKSKSEPKKDVLSETVSEKKPIRSAKSTASPPRGHVAQKEESVGVSGDEDELPNDILVRTWRGRPAVTSWLQIEPPLGKQDLRPYFTYFRSRLVVGSVVSKLAIELQEIFSRLTSESPVVRRAAATDAANLGKVQQDELLEVVLSDLKQRPEGSAWDAAGELVSRINGMAPGLCVVLSLIPHRLIPHLKVPALLSRIPDGSDRDGLIAAWKSSAVAQLSAVGNVAARGRTLNTGGQ